MPLRKVTLSPMTHRDHRAVLIQFDREEIDLKHKCQEIGARFTQTHEGWWVPETDFDVDHEGRGGWTSGQILSELESWLNETGAPDIVLFSSTGGNDALEELPYQNAVQNINEIIDILQANNPNITIIIEQMAPGRSDIMTPELTDYFEQLKQEVLSIATNQSTSTSQVIVVDMFTSFNDSLLADDVHYNEAGAEFIAYRYYNVLENILEE